MKNIFRFLMAVAVLFTASCAKEDISSSIGGGEVEVTFTANLPELGTRAYGEGSEITTLRYEVYSNGQTLSDLGGTTGITIATDPITVNLVLIKGMSYDILFWADNGSDIYSINGGVVSIDPTTEIEANDESRDAFYAAVKGFNPATAEPDDTIINLYRPFAQLNAKVTNMDEVNKSITLTTSTISTKIYTTFNPFAANETEILGGLTAEPVEFTATAMTEADKAAGHLSMNYLFAPADGCVADVAFTFNNNKGVAIAGTTYTSVPLKANYRTNIIGELLTNSTNFTVEIKPGFDIPDQDVVQTAAELQQQIEDAPEGEEIEIVLGDNIDLNDLLASLGTMSTRAATTPSLTIPAGKNIVLNLNGCTLSATENSTGSYALITNKGTLTISDSKGGGKMELTATENRYWNAYSSVISNTVGGVLTVNGGTIEHLGGTDMAYGIDNLTNGKGTSAVATINGGTVKSTYRAVRQFLNGIEANNSLTVNGGVIVGANKSIWMQDPSKSANTGTLTVGANASLTGDVYLFVTAGSTEWPVEVSIAKDALVNPSQVISANVPEGYNVVEVDGVYVVDYYPAKIGETGYKTLQEAIDAVQADETIVLQCNITVAEPIVVAEGKSVILDLNGKTVTAVEYAFENSGDLSIKGNGVVNGIVYNGDGGEIAINGGTYNAVDGGNWVLLNDGGKLTINNATINGGSSYPIYSYGANANLVINDATVNATFGCINSYGIGNTVEINGGTYQMTGVQGKTSHIAYFSNVDATINGGTFQKIGDINMSATGGGGICVISGAKLTITGGNFAGDYADVYDWGGTNASGRPNSISITGGTYKFKPSFVTDGYKAVVIDGLYYVVAGSGTVVTTTEEFSNALKSGGEIILFEDVALNKIDLTTQTQDVVINANGNTITTSSNYGVQVTAGKNITLKNAIVEITVEGNYINYAAGFKVENGDYQGKTISLENCEIRMCNTDWAYAVNMPASVKNLNLVIDGCTLEGAIALQCWGDNNTITITNSNLICNYTTSSLYTSYCVALQGDGANNSENNTLNISGCAFSYSGVDNYNSTIKAVSNHKYNGANTITVDNCTYGEKVKAYN